MENKKTTAKDPGLIYDVGMHKGQDTDFYLKKGFRVVGFEANPENAAFCRERFADAIGDGRLVIVEGAIAENFSSNGIPARIKFYRNENHSLWGSTSDDWAYRNEVMGTTHEVIDVEAVDFGKCVEKHGVPFYLKADIVGSEVICLRALTAFENKPDYLSIRSEKVIFRRLEAEFDLLEELGYDKFKAVRQDFEKIDMSVPGPGPDGEVPYESEEGGSGPFGEDSPGVWKDREAVLKDYKKVFVNYWLFGDYSFLIQTQKGKKLIKQLERVVRRSLPGWYDTHARHSTVIPS
jgi:FkbM family methyltransferase